MQEEQNLLRLLNIFVNLPRETEWIEFKVNFFNAEKIGQYISALSNSANLHAQQFAYFIRWVRDDDHEIVGTTLSLKSQKVGNQDFELRLFQRLSPKIDVKIYELTTEKGKRVIIIRIPCAIQNPTLFDQTAYIRINSSNQSLSNYPDMERKIWQNPWWFAFETQVALQNLSEKDVLKYLDVVSYYALLDIVQPLDFKVILDHFIYEEFIILNLDWTYSITNLWAILFAKNLSLFWSLRRKAIRLIKYQGITRESGNELEWGKWYASGFWNLIKYISTLSSSREEYQDDWFRQDWTIPTIIIREIVANALIHQDFLISGSGVMIEIFDNRIEVTNPWKPLIKIDRFLDHSPRSRNEKLAAFMRRIKICEERGSWIDKVIISCEKNNLPAPDFSEWEWFTRVTIFWKKNLENMTDGEKMDTIYWHTCLKYISWEYMTNASLRTRFAIDDNIVISRLIKTACAKNIIKNPDSESKSRKHTKYIPYRWG